MAAISLYKGNLHRVPNVRRRWLMPSRRISLKKFKSLFHRRSSALSRLRSSNVSVSSPNPNSNAKETAIDSQSNQFRRKVRDQGCLEVGQCSGSVKLSDVSNSPPPGEKPEVAKIGGAEAGANLQDLKLEKTDASANPNIELTAIADDTNDDDKDKREKEVKEKLGVLNQKKHNLVQVLKQVLNVEEELKRRNSVPICANVPLQVYVSNDSWSMSREATPRVGLETNLGDDIEGERK